MKQCFGLFFLMSMLLLACSPTNVKSDANIVKLMDTAKVKGCFALMENGSGQFTITNLSMYKDSSFAPLHTFFAVPSLIALDKGYINHDAKTWVGADSVVYYQNLIEKIGRTDMLKMLDSLHYGKGIVSSDLANFWRDGSLRISPDEQLGFMKRLYFNQLPFQKRSQDLYKKMILKEDNTNYKLSYIYGEEVNGADAKLISNWVLGYVEENKHPYFFVLYTRPQQSNVANTAGASISLLKSILTQQGFLKGVR